MKRVSYILFDSLIYTTLNLGRFFQEICTFASWYLYCGVAANLSN